MVIGLAGFGIQDVLRSSGQNEVATFGDQKITSDDYVRMIQQEIRNLSQQFGTNLTFTQAESFGISQIALQKLVTSTILDQVVEDQTLSQSDASLERSIKNSPPFMDIAGRFSPEKYRDILLNINLKTNEYEEILRKELSRNLLLELTSTSPKLEETIEIMIAEYFLEKRQASLIVLKEKDLGKINIVPTDLEIQTFYEQSKDLFTQPETKNISYVYLSKQGLSEEQNVSNLEIEQAYKLQKDAFNQPEKRDVDQIFFDTEDSAFAALTTKETKLLSFQNSMINRGLNKDDVSLGEVTKLDLPTAVQEKIFSLNTPGIVGPLKTKLGFALYRLNKITPAVVQNLSDQYENIKRQISLEKANAELIEIMNFANDELAGGLNLEEVAKLTKLNFGKLEVFTGASLPDFANSVSFRTALRSAKNYASDVDFDDSGGIFSIRLDKTEKPFVKDFKTVKDIAIEKLIDKKLIEKLEYKANSIVKNLKNNGIDLSEFAKKEQYELIKEKKFSRFEKSEQLPEKFSETLFSLNLGDLSVVPHRNNVYIVKLDIITPAALTSEDGLLLRDQISSQFSKSLEQDIFSALIRELEKTHKFFINQKAVNATIARFN